jgi:hypothetical protein
LSSPLSLDDWSDSLRDTLTRAKVILREWSEKRNTPLIKRIPQQERSQARFEAVLEAALHLFASRGYENTSMREIARDAKMPIATVY